MYDNIKTMQEKLKEISMGFERRKEILNAKNSVQIMSKALSEKLNLPKVNSIAFNLYSIGFSNVVKEYAERMSEPLKEIQKLLSEVKPISRINGADVDKIDKFYWVIPYEIEYDKLSNVLEYKSKDEFNNFILEWFNDDRVKRILKEINEKCETDDKKILLNQIEKSFFDESYALCTTVLVTLLDGLTLELITEDSEYQHLSYKAIDSMLEYINEAPLEEFEYELYLKVYILNNFYNKLYENERVLKNNKKNTLSRHLSSHGVKYVNTKLDCLRMLNAIYFCQEILNETEMKNRFLRNRNEREFNIKEES